MSENSLSDNAFEEEYYLECERRHVFFILMFVAGFYGAFTYTIRGGVFCNAQTANFVLFAMALGEAKWHRALYYLIPMTAYLLGAIVSESLPTSVKKVWSIRWDTLLILVEIVVVIILGFLPENIPFQVTQVAINFICSMQYNTFRQARGIPMATTFCTNHLRQTGVSIVHAVKKNSDQNSFSRLIHHVGMLSIFVAGGISSTILCRYLLGKAIWVTLIPLTILLIDLLYADLKTERAYLEQKPRGH